MRIDGSGPAASSGLKRDRPEELEREGQQEEQQARGDGRPDVDAPPLAVNFDDEEAPEAMETETGADTVGSIEGGIYAYNVDGPPWYDDRTGEVLDPTQVAAGQQAERENLEYFKVKEVTKAKHYPGVRVIPCRWVLTKKK